VKTNQGINPHSRQGRIVVAASFITMSLLYGIWHGYSVFFVAFLREFGWSRALIAGTFSICAIVHASVGPLFGALEARCDFRRIILAGACMVAGGLFLVAETTEWWHLYLAFGVITAAGMGLCGYVPCVVLVREWFPARSGTAVGIATAGIGVGMAMLFPLSQFMIDWIGWRWAFRVLGGLVITWMIPATIWLLRRAPHARQPGRSKEEPDSRRLWDQAPHWTLAKALWSWRFWGLVGVLFTLQGAVQILMTHQVAYLVDHGVPAIVAASVGGIVGLTAVAGKVVWGYLLDRILREVVLTITSILFILGAGALALAGVYPAAILPYTYAVLMGLGHAVIAPITPAVAGDLFGGPGFSTIFGAFLVPLGFGSAIGAWGAGEIFDRTGSYALALWAAVALTVFSCALLWVVAPRRPNPLRSVTRQQ